MAGKLVLPPRNMAGLPFIYNVSNHVGPRQANPNDPDDVQLVQVLIREVLRTSQVNFRPELLKPSPTGVFDTTTAFWIYKWQADGLEDGRVRGAQIDGIVSPARGVIYAGESPWVIVRLNFELNQNSPTVWRELPNNQELRPSLRASLK